MSTRVRRMPEGGFIVETFLGEDEARRFFEDLRELLEPRKPPVAAGAPRTLPPGVAVQGGYRPGQMDADAMAREKGHVADIRRMFAAPKRPITGPDDPQLDDAAIRQHGVGRGNAS